MDNSVISNEKSPSESLENTATKKNKTPNIKKSPGLTIKTKRRIFIICMLALPIIQYLVFFVYVNIDTILMSFREADHSLAWGFDNYYKIFKQFFDPTDNSGMQIKQAMLNSLFVGINDFVLLTLSTIFAYFFFRKIKGAGVFRILFFLPSIISMVIYISVFKNMFDADVGVINQLLKLFGVTNLPDFLGAESSWLMPLVLIYCLWVGTGYNILVMGGAMSNIPEDVMEYSRLEGVGFGREFFQIVVPMIWPTLMVGILNSITVMFTLFLQVDLMTSGTGGNSNQAYTIAFLINKLVKQGGVTMYRAATFGVIFTILAIPIILVARGLLNKASEKFGY